ncbi:hypothetical protein BaRGS_00029145 [Batillaria attramentaria]|uniref:Uncharacterized protein n=1 Tax=Batillaria attramentaria TaxID=370345 RepID=A0ABD0JY82_9CAEN
MSKPSIDNTEDLMAAIIMILKSPSADLTWQKGAKRQMANLDRVDSRLGGTLPQEAVLRARADGKEDWELSLRRTVSLGSGSCEVSPYDAEQGETTSPEGG